MDFLFKLLENKKVMKIARVLSLIVLGWVILFLGFNLIKFSRGNTYNDDVPLYYEFKPNTIKAYKAHDYSNADISEEFLSYGVSYGIDVSEWQGDIDWERVAKTGISFAMIRCGYRQIKGSEIHEDAKFRENMEGAIKAGLTVGVYFYGTAKNESEALEEAMFTIDLIKDYNITYPVVYDAETFNNGRLLGVSYSTITDNILTFTETIGSYGYETMVYSYYDAFMYMLDTGRLDGKLIWLSHFSGSTGYTGNYNMWQYSEEGKVDGINTKVDLNISYFKYVENEEDIIDNPRYKYYEENGMRQVNDRVKTKSDAVFRVAPMRSMPTKMGTIKRGVELERIGVNEEYSKVIYNGKTVYIGNDEILVLSP